MSMFGRTHRWNWDSTRVGKGDAFDKALVRFSTAYADQNEKDHAALKRAVRSGKLEAVFEDNR